MLIGLGVLLVAFSVAASVAGFGPIRLNWPETVDSAALTVVGGYARFDAQSNLEILGEVENGGSTDLGPVFVGVSLLDSAGNPVEAGSDPDTSRAEDLIRMRLKWQRHVNVGKGARKRVPPGERTPFKIEIDHTRVVPFASLRFVADALESKPAPTVSVRGLVREPALRGNVIRGEVVNATSVSCDDPTIVIALHDSSGTLLETYTAYPDLDVLPAGATDTFERRDSSAWTEPRIDGWAHCR